jgi:hypothetical protein
VFSESVDEEEEQTGAPSSSQDREVLGAESVQTKSTESVEAETESTNTHTGSDKAQAESPKTESKSNTPYSESTTPQSEHDCSVKSKIPTQADDKGIDNEASEQTEIDVHKQGGDSG